MSFYLVHQTWLLDKIVAGLYSENLVMKQISAKDLVVCI